MFFKIDPSIDFIEKIDKSRAVEIGVAGGGSLPPPASFPGINVFFL